MIEERARRLHAARDYRALWELSFPVVKAVIGRFIREGKLRPEQSTDDLLQEAYLSMGRAVRVWDPAKGAFSTWIWSRTRGAILNHVARECSGVVGGRDTKTHSVSFVDDLAIDETRDTFSGMVASKESQAIREALAGLDVQARMLLTRHYGLGILGASEPLSDIAVDWKIGERTVRKMLMRAIAKMRLVLSHQPTAEHASDEFIQAGL